MKTHLISIIILLLFWGIAQKSHSQSSTIEEAWVTSADNGFYVHSKVNITGMKGKKTKVLATFYDKDKKGMKGVKQGYINIGKGACASNVDTPQYDNTTYNDFQVFVPKDALSLEEGLNTYFVRVSIYDIANEKFIGKTSNYISFQAYKDKSKSTNPSGSQYFQQIKVNQLAKSDNSKKVNSRVSSNRNTSQPAKSKFTKVFYYAKTGHKNYYTFDGNICYESDANGNIDKLSDIFNDKSNIYKYEESSGGFKHYYWRHPTIEGIWKRLSVAEDFSKLSTYSSVGGTTFEYLDKIDESKLVPMPPITSVPIYVPRSSSSGPEYIDCVSCHGTGNCWMCGGKAWKRWNDDSPMVECPECHGGGKCQSCYGKGKVRL